MSADVVSDVTPSLRPPTALLQLRRYLQSSSSFVLAGRVALVGSAGSGTEVQQPDATTQEDEHDRGQCDQHDADHTVAELGRERAVLDSPLVVRVAVAVVGPVHEPLPPDEYVALSEVTLNADELQRVEGASQDALSNQTSHDTDDQQFELPAPEVVADVRDAVGRPSSRNGTREVEKPPDEHHRGGGGGQECQRHSEDHVPNRSALALLEPDGNGAEEQRDDEADEHLAEIMPRVDPPGRLTDRAQGHEERLVEQIVDMNRQPVPRVLEPDVDERTSGAVSVLVADPVVCLEQEEVHERADGDRELGEDHAARDHLHALPLGEAVRLHQLHFAADNPLPTLVEPGKYADCHVESSSLSQLLLVDDSRGGGCGCRDDGSAGCDRCGDACGDTRALERVPSGRSPDLVLGRGGGHALLDLSPRTRRGEVHDAADDPTPVGLLGQLDERHGIDAGLDLVLRDTHSRRVRGRADDSRRLTLDTGCGGRVTTATRGEREKASHADDGADLKLTHEIDPSFGGQYSQIARTENTSKKRTIEMRHKATDAELSVLCRISKIGLLSTCQ